MTATLHRDIEAPNLTVTGNLITDILVRSVVTCGADATGGATDSTVSVQLARLDGSPVTSARVVLLAFSTLSGVPYSASSTASLGAATTGSVVIDGTGYGLVKTNAAGLFEGAITNSADQTLYISAISPNAIPASATPGDCSIVVSAAEDTLVWSA